MRTRFLFAVIALLPLACQRAPAPSATNAGSDTASSGKPGSAMQVQALRLPTSPGSAQPNLVATPDGRLLLSWISSVPGRRKALQFDAMGNDGQWQGAPRTIAIGDSLSANWANMPHITATTDGALWVHWLQATSADDEEATDVMLSRSVDGGSNWSPPALVNTDGTTSEHGFATLWPATRDSIGIAWLDGRNAAEEHDGAMPAGHDHAAKEQMHMGAMTLRAAIFDGAFRRSGETELDAMTCDCCATSVALTTRGPVLAYRDRTPEEIRDIATTRFDGKAWTAPKTVNADGWKMTGCPVNGPAAAANGDAVVVGWYTGANDKPTVKLTRSADAGDTFAAPITVDASASVQGRVAVALDAAQAWVLWVREDASGQSLWLARYAPDLAHELQRSEIAKLQGRGNATGYPQLALRNGSAYIVWTDIIDGAPQLRGAVFGSR